LLYLNDQTFIGQAGDKLAGKIRDARMAGLTVAMIHETDEGRRGCEFSTFFETTPSDLIDSGLYNTIATTFVSGEGHRRVSHILFARHLGAEAHLKTNIITRNLPEGSGKLVPPFMRGSSSSSKTVGSNKSVISLADGLKSDTLTSTVQVFDGFLERSVRLVYPYSNRLEHLSEEETPYQMTILASGAVENDPKPLYLGGLWTRKDLESKGVEELIDIGSKHGVKPTQEVKPESEKDVCDQLVGDLVGMKRDLSLRDRALISYPMAQTMSTSAAAGHLGTVPNSNFVFTREDGTVAVVHCWPVKYNEKFRSTFECTEKNPDKAIFSLRMVAEFRQAMRNLFGPSADQVPIVYARKEGYNPYLVLVGTQEALIDFINTRKDIQNYMSILEVFANGFISNVKINGESTGTRKKFVISEQGKSVVYMKTGHETMACSKALFLFKAECELGTRLTTQTDLTNLLTPPSTADVERKHSSTIMETSDVSRSFTKIVSCVSSTVSPRGKRLSQGFSGAGQVGDPHV